MSEKRRSIRLPLNLTLSICDLYKQDVSGIHQLDAPIAISDISEHGLGFTSECILPLSYYFHASLNSGTKIHFTATLKIIRCCVLDTDLYSYGGEFLNLNEHARNSIREFTALNS